MGKHFVMERLFPVVDQHRSLSRGNDVCNIAKMAYAKNANTIALYTTIEECWNICALSTMYNKNSKNER